MLNKIKTIFLLGVILLAAVATTVAQDMPGESDTTGYFEYKDFLDYKTVLPFGPTVDKKQSTYAISTVVSEDFRTINTPSLSNSLAGKLTGLMVSQSGGAPGENFANLQIRGVQTFLDEGMMVVVDGFQTDWHSILPDEVESIHVLKDAAALAPFGISGANGVLYIKTKTGVERTRNKVTFNSRVSFQQPATSPTFLSNGDYAELYNVAMVSDGKDIANGYFSTPQIVDYFKNQTYPNLYPDVDWYNEIVKPGAIAQDYNLSVNGGNDIALYNVLIGFTNTPGLYDGTDGTNNSNWIYSRYVSRINLDLTITDWLRAEIKTRGMLSTTKQPMAGPSAIWSSMNKFLPFAVTTQDEYWGGTQGYSSNPMAEIMARGYQIENNRTIDANVKVVADLPFIPGASIFGQVVFANNYYSYYRKSRNFAYQEVIPDLFNPGEIDTTFIVGDINENFSYSQPSGTQWNRSNMLGGLEYQRTLGEGELYASAMYMREIYTVSLAINEVPWAKINLFGRVNYAHQGKYIAEFGYSYSGTDNYAPESRFGFFPSVSAAWVASREDFMSDNAAISFLKLRASTGLVGNDRIGNLDRFMFQQWYGSPSGSYRLGNTLSNNHATVEPLQLGNPDATWEKAHKTNVGVDAQLFNKLSLSLDYFFEKRTDIFVDPANNLSAVIGSRYYEVNEGSAKSSGFEGEMVYMDRVGSLGFYAGARVSVVNTEIIDMGEPPRAYDYLYRRGNPIGQPFILEAIGFFSDETDIATSPVQTFGTVSPGDVKYKDQNDDGFIDDNDLIASGDPWYPGLIYSFDAGIDFMGFDLSVFFQGVGRRSINLNQNYMIPFLNENKPFEWIADNYWRPDVGEDALYPRLTTEDNTNNYRGSTLWQRDGSYFRIKNIELGYTLPAGLTGRLGIERLRIYANAVNPVTWDKIDELDIDPEINNPLIYPSMKMYNLGLTLNF